MNLKRRFFFAVKVDSPEKKRGKNFETEKKVLLKVPAVWVGSFLILSSWRRKCHYEGISEVENELFFAGNDETFFFPLFINAWDDCDRPKKQMEWDWEKKSSFQPPLGKGKSFFLRLRVINYVDVLNCISSPSRSNKVKAELAMDWKRKKKKKMVQLFYYENRGKSCRKLWKHNGDSLKVTKL